jgi:alanyl-tRNA synthetase
MKSEQIRKKWREFWESSPRNHRELKPAPLVPQGDKTSLFTVAGMQQLVPYLSWKPHPDGKRLYNIQKCVRTPDIDEIWDERHLTMFEMMWNWSLGDYFKKESLTWSVEFLTKVCGIPLEKIWATIFAGDEKLGLPEDAEARKILNELGIPNERIRPMKENWWWPAGEIGPCGPDCEFYVDRWEEFWPSDWLMDDNDRYTEIWNNVFMEFYKNEDWTFTKLPQQNVDTGMGLERLAMILQWKKTIFETDLFEWIIKTIEKYTNKKYPPYSVDEEKLSDTEKQITRRFRIITDHLRGSLFLIADGVLPSNEGRGYVLRRLIRRAFYNFYLLNKEVDYKKAVNDIYKAVESKYWEFRTNLKNNENLVKILVQEMEKFQRTISKWLKLIDEIINEIKAKNQNMIDGGIVFKLYDTYGFPLELTKEIAESNNLKIDEKWFKQHMHKAKEKSKANAKDVFKRWIDWAKYLEGIPPTEFVGYEKLELENPKVLKYFEVDWNKIYIFDKTPFYAEWGWQTGDRWEIILDDGKVLKVKDVKKFAGVYLHFVE